MVSKKMLESQAPRDYTSRNIIPIFAAVLVTFPDILEKIDFNLCLCNAADWNWIVSTTVVIAMKFDWNRFHYKETEINQFFISFWLWWPNNRCILKKENITVKFWKQLCSKLNVLLRWLISRCPGWEQPCCNELKNEHWNALISALFRYMIVLWKIPEINYSSTLWSYLRNPCKPSHESTKGKAASNENVQDFFIWSH